MTFLEKLRAVIEDTSTVKGKIFDYFIFGHHLNCIHDLKNT